VVRIGRPSPALIALAIALASLALPASAAATFPGTNGKIYFTATQVSSSTNHLYRVSPDGTGLLDLTANGGGPTGVIDPAVSADGTKIAYTVGAGSTSEIWISNNDGTSAHKVTNNAFLDQQPAFSPDGTKLVFASARDVGLTAFDIWTVNVDGTGEQVLANSSRQQFGPEFTADGQTVVYYYSTAGNFELAKVASSGGPYSTDTNIVSTTPADERVPSVSPDTQANAIRVTFARTPSGNSGDQTDLYAVDLDDGMNDFSVAANATDSEGEPSYSPTGLKLVYVLASVATGTTSLIVSNFDGSNAAPVPLDSAVVHNPNSPAWSVPAADPTPPPVTPPVETPIETPPDQPPAATPDSTPPDTTITKAPRAKMAGHKAKFVFSASESNATFECALDASGFAACDSPHVYKHLHTGHHRFDVRAVDAAGNADQSPATARFKVVKHARHTDAQ
jgi:Tol biopolymer transport system component